MSHLSTRFDPQAAPPKKTGVSASVMAGDIDSLVRLFGTWREQTPDISKTVDTVIGAFNFPRQTLRLIRKAAELAAEPNPNPFHNNEHFLEVFILAATLGARAYQEKRITQNNLGLLLSAALVHDYKHDGGKNVGQQYRLEDMAMDNAEPHLRKTGANDIDIKILRALVLTTDVSKDFADPKAISPAESIKFHVRIKDPASPFSKLEILYRFNLTEVALMLQDADIGASLISPKLCREGSQNLAAEMGIDFDPSLSTFFLEKICHKRAFSQSGRTLIQPYLDKVLKDFGVSGNGSADAPAFKK